MEKRLNRVDKDFLGFNTLKDVLFFLDLFINGFRWALFNLRIEYILFVKYIVYPCIYVMYVGVYIY